MIQRFCLLVAAALLIGSCMSTRKELQTGDLLFVAIPADYQLDSTSMDSAIAASTSQSLRLIHTAIVEVRGDSTWVIDATIKRGVARYPLQEFLQDFTLKDGSLPVLMVKRLKQPYDVEDFVERAKTFIGQPYDVAFLPDNDAMYCTELVRESYRPDGTGWLFPNKPMNFQNEDGTYPPYWEQLFALLEMPIPQGVMGTNPEEMSKSGLLRDIDCSF